ncbi:hypothetical protein BBO99_00004099 [Phytophthora kernoviae]|uniref:Pentacotripeptide-repeat region of PRORP domain-containing protein n=2 Tax=Phytophthora kernoviae TaxID=325452 RepID=A0A421GSN5_9STRA|nr:hypothetical protein G195_004726 [Phytophthora kernoviae 00238/432]KAG2526490.1 hypothetical protein JM16_002883 [Phytophthora kernoviae]KAG2527985.1 hypothetical protein JM18_003442 [Phytophthora kernoviae]RLN14623.1 hypothetical protein BBI17_004197 [Phytophthora kernoviae]RLN81005.1 hypothetical protein BBO99_00004099 [Phytophthora kernoviae]
MWRVCRVAALRHLRSEAARLPAAAHAHAPFALQHVQSACNFTSIAGVDRELLLKRSARELRDEIGNAQMGDVAKALRSEIDEAMNREDITSNEIIDLFTVAQKTRAVSVMMDAYDFLEEKFPTHINFAVYGELFRILVRRNEGERMIQIYETVKPRFRGVPEMIYRFGIVGHLQNDDVDAAMEICEEMANAGHEATNEITSRLMMAFATRGDKDKVQEMYDSVDPQIGYWHESCIDRVILSMGIIEQPGKSFEFYSNSSMKLSGGTLMALLSVCSNNNCKQQASDILANRKKFDLRLDARGYNRIMMTLEFLERNDEIKDILDEMSANNVRFDTRTHNITKRNSEHLQGTNYVSDNTKSKAAGFTISPRIRELLDQGAGEEAATIVDSNIKPVKESSFDIEGTVPEGALIVSPSLARDAVQAYIMTGQHDKVEALINGFSVVRGKYTFALVEAVTHYLKLETKLGDNMGYLASKALLFQGSPIYRVDDTMALFRRFHDPDATLQLFNQVLEGYATKKNSKVSSRNDGIDNAFGENGTGETKLNQRPKYYVKFNIGKVINSVLQTLGENDRLTDILYTLDNLEHYGLESVEMNYVAILRAMCKGTHKQDKTQHRMYDPTSFQAVLQHFKARGFKATKTIVGYLCPGYKGADKQQRLELLEAYSEARSDPNDTYVLPLKCYETLLLFTAQEGDVSEFRQTYEEAVATLNDKENSGVPRSWLTILITKLSMDGHIEEAAELAKKMPELCGGYTYSALMSVLRNGMENRNMDIVDNMIALFEERDFILQLSDAYDLVHLARRNDLSLKGLDIIRLYEKKNLKDVPEAEDGKGNLKTALVRRNGSDPHIYRKVKTMYSVVLKTCEKTGLWKQALVLRERMVTLFGEEALNEIAMNHSAQKKQRRSWDDLEGEFGSEELKKVRQTLPMTWKKLSIEEEMAPDLVKEFFTAARQCQLFKLQWEVFKYMEMHYLDQVTYEMYGQMFDYLMTNKEPEKMQVVFERAISRYDPEQGRVAPEIVFRIGICAAIALADYVEMQALMHKMVANGVEPSVEIVTRVLVARAKHGDAKAVLATAANLNPLDGRNWHEADVNRVIASLGISGDPDAAFDFYRRTQTRLSSHTVMALMHVCRENARPKHALAILANRRRFGLKMLPAQYPRLLEIIEELDIAGAPASEMALVLQEMKENGVWFGNRVHAVIARNQQHLQGTPFMATILDSNSSDGQSAVHAVVQVRDKGVDVSLVRELLDTRKFAQAAAIVDAYTKPVSEKMISGNIQGDQDKEAMIVPGWLADMAVEAYSQNQEVHKVQSLVQGFSCARGNFRHALTRTVGLFGGKGKMRNNRIAYDAFLAMQFQGFAIFRVRDALARFDEFQDTQAILELLDQMAAEIAEAVHATGGAKNGYDTRGCPVDLMHTLGKSGKLHFDPRRAIRDAFRILVSTKQLEKVVAALDHLGSYGVPVRTVDYESIFAAMNKANATNEVFSPEDFMVIWEDMTCRGVAPSKTILRLTIPALCSKTETDDADEWEIRQRAIIQGYHQAALDRHDIYVLSVSCFSTLLAAAAEAGSVDDVQTVYSGAVKSLGASMNKKNLSPADHSEMMETWATVRLEKVAAENSALDAMKLLRKMPSPSYSAVVTVLYAGYRNLKHDMKVVDDALMIFRQYGYELKVSDAERLMHAAKTANSLEACLRVVHMCDDTWRDAEKALASTMQRLMNWGECAE